MCTHPLTVKNPYYGLGDKGFNALHNTHTQFISVPCGQCKQCLSMRQAWFNQRVQMESLRSHLFMITLTYNDFVPVLDFKGYKLQFPDYRDIQNMCKRIRKKGWKFRYWFCSEYGRKRKRPHYHGLIAIDRNDYPDVHWSVLEQTFSKLFLDHWTVNVGSRQNPKYKPLLTYVKQRNKCTYDFHHVEPVPGHDNDLSFYCSKYVLKYDDRTDKLLKKILLDPVLDDHQTSLLYGLIKPRSVMSKDFGDYNYPDIKNYISSCLARSQDLPQFYDLHTGASSLMSPYYRKHLVPFEYQKSVLQRLSIMYDSMCIDDGLSILEQNINASLKSRHENGLKRVRRLCKSKY